MTLAKDKDPFQNPSPGSSQYTKWKYSPGVFLKTNFDKSNRVLLEVGKPSLKPTNEAIRSLTP